MLVVVNTHPLVMASYGGASWAKKVAEGLVSAGASGVCLVRIGDHSVPHSYLTALKLLGAFGNFTVSDEVFPSEEGDPVPRLSRSDQLWREQRIVTLFFTSSDLTEFMQWIATEQGGAARLQFLSEDGSGITPPPPAE